MQICPEGFLSSINADISMSAPGCGLYGSHWLAWVRFRIWKRNDSVSVKSIKQHFSPLSFNTKTDALQALHEKKRSPDPFILPNSHSPGLFASPPRSRFLFSPVLPSLWSSCVSQKPACVAVLVCSEFIILLFRAPIAFHRFKSALLSVFSWFSAHFISLQTFAPPTNTASPLNHRSWSCKLGCSLHLTCVRKKSFYTVEV